MNGLPNTDLMTVAELVDRINAANEAWLNETKRQIRRQPKWRLSWWKTLWYHIATWHPYSLTNILDTLSQQWERRHKGWCDCDIFGWAGSSIDYMISSIEAYRDYPGRGAGGGAFMQPVFTDEDRELPEVRNALSEHTATLNEILLGLRAAKIMQDNGAFPLYREFFADDITPERRNELTARMRADTERLEAAFHRSLDLLKENWLGMWV